MTKEEKDLLLQDLCARLPYGVKIQYDIYGIYDLTVDKLNAYIKGIKNIKPYLRPMSNMTEEEYNEVGDLLKAEDPNLNLDEVMATIEIDWLNAHHFDYRGLIEKGLAIEVTKDNNSYKD